MLSKIISMLMHNSASNFTNRLYKFMMFHFIRLQAVQQGNIQGRGGVKACSGFAWFSAFGTKKHPTDRPFKIAYNQTGFRFTEKGNVRKKAEGGRKPIGPVSPYHKTSFIRTT
jgi:hypothetical protein